jgi:hypothetical protein
MDASVTFGICKLKGIRNEIYGISVILGLLGLEKQTAQGSLPIGLHLGSSHLSH